MLARVPGWWCAAPCQNPRPGQACSTAMPTRKTPVPARMPRPIQRAGPGPLGQRDQRTGHGVDENRPGRAEQPGQPGCEDPAERLAEGPDHQAPADASQPGQPGQQTAGCGEYPDADPDLDPHGGRSGLHRVIRPVSPGPVHHLLDPVRGTRRGGLDDLRGQPDGHLRLGLQDPIEDPQQAEPDPQHLPPGRLRHGRRRRAAGGGLSGQPRPHGDPGEAEQREDQQRDDSLVHVARP